MENDIDFQRDFLCAEETFGADNFDWVEDLMPWDLPSLEYDWPREEDAGATATLTDISSSPNTLLDNNYPFPSVEAPHAFQNDVYDPEDVGPYDSPLLKPLIPKLQPTSSPPSVGPESGDAKLVPSQGDAVLISLLGGGKALEVAHTAATELLASDDEMSDGSEKGVEVSAGIVKTGGWNQLEALAAVVPQSRKLKTAHAQLAATTQLSPRSDKINGFTLSTATAQLSHLTQLADAATATADIDLNSVHRAWISQSPPRPRFAESSFEVLKSAAMTEFCASTASLTCNAPSSISSSEDLLLPRSRSAEYSRAPTEPSMRTNQSLAQYASYSGLARGLHRNVVELAGQHSLSSQEVIESDGSPQSLRSSNKPISTLRGGLPPPASMPLLQPTQPSPTPGKSLSSQPPGELPAPPQQWQGSEEPIENQLATMVEEDKARREEEQSSLETLRLERKGSERAFQSEFIPPHRLHSADEQVVPCSLNTTNYTSPTDLESLPSHVSRIYFRHSYTKIWKLPKRAAKGVLGSSYRKESEPAVEIDKAIVCARRANRNKLGVLFEKPVHAMKALWLVPPFPYMDDLLP